MDSDVWESSRIVWGVGESLGLVRLFPVIKYRAEVTDGQLEAAYISRYVWFGLYDTFKYLNSQPTFKSWRI